MTINSNIAKLRNDDWIISILDFSVKIDIFQSLQSIVDVNVSGKSSFTLNLSRHVDTYIHFIKCIVLIMFLNIRSREILIINLIKNKDHTFLSILHPCPINVHITAWYDSTVSSNISVYTEIICINSNCALFIGSCKHCIWIWFYTSLLFGVNWNGRYGTHHHHHTQYTWKKTIEFTDLFHFSSILRIHRISLVFCTISGGSYWIHWPVVEFTEEIVTKKKYVWNSRQRFSCNFYQLFYYPHPFKQFPCK